MLTGIHKKRKGWRTNPSAATVSMVLLGCAIVPFAQAENPQTDPGYVLGPGDQISIHVLNFEDFGDKPVPIDLTGAVHLPAIGRVPAAGLTTAQLEGALAQR